MNLIDKLLTFAHGQEDVLTETLAWFLRHCAPFRQACLADFETLLVDQRFPRADGVIAPPGIDTQVVEADSKEGTCRYDLVVSWPGTRLIIEVKVWADLTWRQDSDGERRHQLSCYLTTSRARRDVRTYLAVLAPGVFDEGLGDEDRAGYIGQRSWQHIHDLLRALDGVDATMKMLADDFARSLEIRHMAIPHVTLEDMRSVIPYRRFNESLRVILTGARELLLREGALAGFAKNNAHGRTGWRLWPNNTNPGYFAFVGIYAASGGDTDVPDLYFMLEAPPKSALQRAFDARAAEVRDKLSRLGPSTKWSFHEGGYEMIRARRSLSTVVDQADHAAPVVDFFRDTLKQLRGTGLLADFTNLAAQAK